MKTLVLIWMGVMLLSVTTIYAKVPPAVADKLPSELKEIIIENLSYPNEAVQNDLEGDVWMKISVTNDSKINVLEINSTNPELGEHVKNELTALKVGNTDGANGQVYYLKVKFDLLMKE